MLLALLQLATAIAVPATRNRRADCSSYESEQKCLDIAPSSANCVWSLRVAGADYDDRACHSKSCDNINYLAGSNEDPKAECNDFGGCTWDDDIFYCYEQGGKIPCTMRYPDGGDTCPSGCEYSELSNGCIDQGGKVLCEVIYDADDCVKNGCEFNSLLYKCWDKGRTIPCREFEYFNRTNCPSYCQYIDTGGGGGGGGGSSSSEGKCITTGTVTACEEYYNEDECPKDRCTYYPDPLERCWAKDKAIPCSDLHTASCMPSKVCQWHRSEDAVDDYDGWCGKCSTSDCSEPAPDYPGGGGGDEPDNGKPCKDHNEGGGGGADNSPCPEPRCFVQYSDNDGDMPGDGDMCGAYSGATCRDAQCIDHIYDETSCTRQPGCAFDTTSNICYDTDGVFPCSEAYQDSECPKAYCEWKAAPTNGNGNAEGDGFCFVKGGEVACTRYSGGAGEICEKQQQGPADGDKCVYLEALETCISKSKAENVPCTAYNQDIASCPTPKCQLLNGVCWKAGEELPCTAVCSAASCLDTGNCVWNTRGNGRAGTCEACKSSGCPVQKACTTYKDEETCPESHCMFEYTEDGVADDDDGYGGYGGGAMAGECVDNQCVGMRNSLDCTGSKLDCTWDDASFSCWPNAFSKPCAKIYEIDACKQNSGCTYNADKYICTEKGQQEFCESQYTESECTALGYCEYSNYKCEEKASNFPSTPPPLNGKGDGTGNEDVAKCTAALYDEVKAKLDAADTECVIHDRMRARARSQRARRGGGGSAKDQQLECLAYFLAQSPNPTTVDQACPCLWAWATEINPGMDHWMKVKC